MHPQAKQQAKPLAQQTNSMKTFTIYERDREYASQVNGQPLGQISANSKEEAEAIAASTIKSVTGCWAVETVNQRWTFTELPEVVNALEKRTETLERQVQLLVHLLNKTSTDFFDACEKLPSEPYDTLHNGQHNLQY